MNPTPFFQTGFLSVILCGSREYILIKEYKTWDEAQDYCRQNYIDLATVQTDEEWSELTELIEKLQLYIWIGLYDDVNTWHWSYQDEIVTFLHWDSEQPNNLNGKQYCVNLRTSGYWWDEACNLTLYYFLCQTSMVLFKSFYFLLLLYCLVSRIFKP
uniref:C-type lectin domain-containing protein n=1 Tax=Sinocyclocheilus rhinocerous TaxID=307959 RepID=A0A673HJR0_9TELE